MPGIEIPNRQIAGNALQYRTVADLLFWQMENEGVNCVLPLLTCASFAIELYLKSLNAFSVYHLDDESDQGEEGQEFAPETSCDGDDEIEDSDVFRVTASAVLRSEHELVTLFQSIDAPIRQQMEVKYRSETHREFVADLTPYNKTFVDTRYCFEKSGGNGLHASISRIIHLSAFVSDFVMCLLRKNT